MLQDLPKSASSMVPTDPCGAQHFGADITTSPGSDAKQRSEAGHVPCVLSYLEAVGSGGKPVGHVRFWNDLIKPVCPETEDTMGYIYIYISLKGYRKKSMIQQRYGKNLGKIMVSVQFAGINSPQVITHRPVRLTPGRPGFTMSYLQWLLTWMKDPWSNGADIVMSFSVSDGIRFVWGFYHKTNVVLVVSGNLR